MKIAICIDYDNLLTTQKSSGILDVVTKVLMKFPQLPKPSPTLRGVCDVRLYGGWYEKDTMSQLAQKISVKIQDEFPRFIRIPSMSEKSYLITTTAELAVSLLEEPSHHLFNTFRKKGLPQNVRVEDPKNIGCTNTICPLIAVKKLLKKGKCPSNECAKNAGMDEDPLIYRTEQKLVDTMLTCDLIYLAHQEYDYIFLRLNMCFRVLTSPLLQTSIAAVKSAISQ
jgi:hypothetical protein